MKYKIGMFFIILGIASPFIGLAVPLFDLDSTTTTSLVAFLMVGGPEVFIILGGAIGGKEAVTSIKSKLFAPAGRIRYQMGIYVLIVGITGNLIFAYINLLELYTFALSNQLILTGIFDITAIVGMLMMGKEFFIKIARIFTWDGENIISSYIDK